MTRKGWGGVGLGGGAAAAVDRGWYRAVVSSVVRVVTRLAFRRRKPGVGAGVGVRINTLSRTIQKGETRPC